MKNLSLIIFIIGQIMGFILLLVASLSPINLLNDHGTNSFSVWSIAAVISILSIVFWRKYSNTKTEISKRKKRWLSLLVNLPNMIVLSAPLILVALVVTLSLDYSRDMRNDNKTTENTPSQQVDPIVKTPADKVKAQGTQNHP